MSAASAQQLDLAKLWIAFGVGKDFWFFAAHEIAKVLGPDWCMALPMFHAFTGCDTVGPDWCIALPMFHAFTGCDTIGPDWCIALPMFHAFTGQDGTQFLSLEAKAKELRGTPGRRHTKEVTLCHGS